MFPHNVSLKHCAFTVQALYETPAVAVPVVAARLEAKQAEWRKVLKDMERTWQKQFDANYARSLDHRSFYFKAIDKKVLGNKHLIAELRAAADAGKPRGASRSSERQVHKQRQ